MKATLVTASAAAFVFLIAGVACGGDDKPSATDDPQTSGTRPDDSDGDGFVANIRTTKGLSAAAVNAGLGQGGDDAETDAESAASSNLASTGVGGAPAPAADSAFALRDSSSDSSSANPQQVGGGGGITVSGYGTATADADSAVLEFYFGNNGGVVYDDLGTPAPADVDAGSLTEADLQPVIDALVAAGIARDDIEVIDQGYYDPYYRSATLRAKARDIANVEAAAQAGVDAAANVSGVTLQSTNVTYTLSDCAAMERAALETAAEDAADHAEILADVLNVGLGGISAASDYSYPYYYYGYNGFDDNVCASSYYGAIPFYSGGTLAGDKTVEVFGNVSITYAIN